MSLFPTIPPFETARLLGSLFDAGVSGISRVLGPVPY